MTIQALPYISFLGFLFGSTLIASRFSVGQFHPVTYIGLRLSLAGLGHVVIYALTQRRKWPTDGYLWRHAIVLGILGTAVPMICIVTALQYLSSGLAAILLTTSPALTVLMAHFMLTDEVLTRRKAAGVLLALGGAALLAIRGENGLVASAASPLIGYVWMLVAMVAASSMTIYARKYMRDLDAFDVASVRMVVAALTVMPLSLVLVGFDLQQVTGQGYFALGYAALVGTFAGMMVAFYNIKRFGATASAMTAYIIPIVAAIGGWLFLDEAITAVMMIGVGLIVLGITIINQMPSTR